MGRRGVVLSVIGIMFLFGIFFAFESGFARAWNIVNVEGNVTASDTYTSIEVDNRTNVNFGNLKRGDVSGEQKICVNNTGTSDIIVTPMLENYTGWLFNNVQIRKFGGATNSHVYIGQYNVNVSIGNQSCMWARLNLNITTPIYQDITGQKAIISMRAMPV